MYADKNIFSFLTDRQTAKFLVDFAETAYPDLKKSAEAVGEPIADAINRWLRSPVPAGTLNSAILKLDAVFATDGDFCFDNLNGILDVESPMYSNAIIKYEHETDDEYYGFHLCARGDTNSCQYAARDLLERLVCNFRTSRYYLIQDVYQLLITAKDQCLWKGEHEIDYVKTLGGNYEGTEIRIQIVRTPT